MHFDHLYDVWTATSEGSNSNWIRPFIRNTLSMNETTPSSPGGVGWGGGGGEGYIASFDIKRK